MVLQGNIYILLLEVLDWLDAVVIYVFVLVPRVREGSDRSHAIKIDAMMSMDDLARLEKEIKFLESVCADTIW